MHTSTMLVGFFASLSFAAPLNRRAGVLGTATYDELSISGGTAGSAEAEALAKFSALDLNDSAYSSNRQGFSSYIKNKFWCNVVGNVAQEDIDFLGAVNDIANDAETNAFNVAIAVASGDELTALQVHFSVMGPMPEANGDE